MGQHLTQGSQDTLEAILKRERTLDVLSAAGINARVATDWFDRGIVAEAAYNYVEKLCVWFEDDISAGAALEVATQLSQLGSLEFYPGIRYSIVVSEGRYGQTLMNVLREMEPTLYDRITDTDADVFYCTLRLT